MNATEDPILEPEAKTPESLIEESPAENLRSSLFRQFVLLPVFVVVVFAVVVGGVFLIFGVFGSEGRTAREYLNEVKTTSGSSRWQAAINLVAELEKTQHTPEMKELQPEIIALLGQVAGSDEALLRYYLVTALGWIGDETAFDAVVKASQDPDLDVRRGALMSLVKISGPRAVPVLIERLRDEQPEIRSQSAWELGYLKAEAAVRPLTVALNDAKEDVRLNAAWALAECGEAAAVPQLLRGLDRKYVTAVYGDDAQKISVAMRQSIRALVKLKHEDAAERIRELSTLDPDLGVRDEAISALRSFGK